MQLTTLIGNDPANLNALQVALAPYNDLLVAFWWALWCTTALYVVVYAWKNRVSGDFE
ncbi:MAG TPA: hypothetical protein VNM40_00995 [Candidatus Paceibacterota bacterium]|nr:hypothetical protein [Candidatus Paceibacterota bacterium]